MQGACTMFFGTLIAFLLSACAILGAAEEPNRSGHAEHDLKQAVGDEHSDEWKKEREHRATVGTVDTQFQ